MWGNDAPESRVRNDLHRWKGEYKAGTSAGTRLDIDRAAVLANDAAGDRETEPSAVGLGGEERIEDAGKHLGRDPGTGVSDHEPYRAGTLVITARLDP